MIARHNTGENTNSPGIRFGFSPPPREPSPGALSALLALVIGFAVVLTLGAAIEASSSRNGITGHTSPKTASVK